MLACLIRGNKHLRIGTLASHVRSVRYMSEVRVCRLPTQVQLMRGEFLETALYWAGVVSVRLGAIAERKYVSIFLCPVFIVCSTASPLVVSYGVKACANNFVHAGTTAVLRRGSP